MKTNKFLMAVALPAFLAACTAEEIEQVSVQDQLMTDRALLSSDFAINVADIESRFAWENAVWKYEAGDQFGAAITDVATQWDVADGSMFGNYIFTKDEAGNYVTDSQMGEGVYMLYSYNEFKTKMARELVKFDLTNQVCDLDDPAAEINKYENQLMITPLYKLQEKYSTKPLAPEFYSFYGVGAFKFKNNSGQDLKITQIILKHTGANDMVVKGRVSQAAFETDAQFVYNEDKEDYILRRIHNALENENLTAVQRTAEIEDAEKDFEATIYKAKAAATVNAQKGDKTSKFITLDCQNYLMENGEEKTAYMFVPAGYTGFEVEIMVVDEEGEAWSVYANASGNDNDGNSDTKGIKVTGMDKLELQRHKGNMIFGKSSDGKTMKTLNITEDNLSENSGYYVDSKAAMLELLDANLGDIKVHNSGDWVIDDEVVEAIIDYTGAGIEFSNPISIKSAKALTNNDEWELALSGVEFNEVTVVGEIKEGNTVLFEGTTAELDVKANKLIIEAGANVTIKNATAFEYVTIENYGTLSVKMDVRASGNGIRTYKTLNVVGYDQPVDLYAGSVTYSPKVVGNVVTPLTVKSSTVKLYGTEETVSVKFEEDVTVNVDADYTITARTRAGKTSTYTNNGKIDLNGKTLTINGSFLNNGVITDGSVVVKSAASLTNNDDLDVATTVEANATLNNNGEAKKVTNNGNIVTGEGSKTEIIGGTVDANRKNGRIDNSAGGEIKGDASRLIVFYEVNNKTVADLETILFKRYSVNTLRVSGTLNMSRGFDLEKVTDVAELLNPTTLELANNAIVKIDKDVHVSFTEVYLDGNATIDGWSKGESTLSFDKAATIHMMQESTASSTDLTGYKLSIKEVTVKGVEVGHAHGATMTYTTAGSITFDETDKEKEVTDHDHYNLPTVEVKDAVLDATPGKNMNMTVDGEDLNLVEIVGAASAPDMVAVVGSEAALNAAWTNAISLADNKKAYIMLTSDVTTNGLQIADNVTKNDITVDFGGHQITLEKPMVGSTGTETQAFHFYKDNTVVLKNGTVASADAKMLVQNYSNLTLDNMTLIGDDEMDYVLSNNCGEVTINNSVITSNKTNGVAFDVCNYSTYANGTQVEVKGNSVINGNIEYGSSGWHESLFKSTLSIGENVTVNGKITFDSYVGAHELRIGAAKALITGWTWE